jgi:hypothetical protein
MKVSLERSQVILLGVSGFALVLGVAFGWWGLGGLAEVSNLGQEIADRKGKSEVANILGRPGGISEVKKEIALLDQLYVGLGHQEESLMEPWRQTTSEAMGDGKDWAKDGNKWKDLLVRYNDEILKKSGKVGDMKKVTLAPSFYLGLEDFKQKSPSDDQVPQLAAQLFVSKRLVDLLFASKEKTQEGYPTACVLLKIQGPMGQEGGGAEGAKPKGKSSEKSDITRENYAMEFECSPEVLYAYISALTKDSWFFIPTNLSLENEKSTFPKRSELVGLFAPKAAEKVATESVRGGSNSTASPLLLVLAGKEKLRVNLQVDFVGWKSTPKMKMEPKDKKP